MKIEKKKNVHRIDEVEHGEVVEFVHLNTIGPFQVLKILDLRPLARTPEEREAIQKNVIDEAFDISQLMHKTVAMVSDLETGEAFLVKDDEQVRIVPHTLKCE